MPPKAAAQTWDQMAPPVTAEQRIAFLSACQRAFETVRVVGPAEAHLHLPAVAASGALPGPCTFSALGCAPTPMARAECVLCAGGTRGGLVANPFADWAVTLCPACAAP